MTTTLPLLLSCVGEPPHGPPRESEPRADTAAEGDSGLGDTAEEPLAPGRPCLMRVTPGVSAAPADGGSAIALHVRATDADGVPLPDGTLLRLHTTSGAIDPLPALVGGEALAVLHSATRPGRPWLSSPDCALLGQLEVTFTPLSAWSVQLHIHGSLSEGTGTMRGFSRYAHEDGLDLLWWTDHDVLYHTNPDLSLSGVDWEEGQLSGVITGTPALGPSEWVVKDLGGSAAASLAVDTFAASQGRYGLRAALDRNESGSPEAHRWRIRAKNLTSMRGTLGGLQLAFSVRRQVVSNAQLRVVVPLSSNGEGDTTERRIVFYDGSTDEESTADTLWVEMGASSGGWHEVVADISALADATWPDDERDLSAAFVDIEIGADPAGGGIWHLDDLQFSQRVVGEDLREAQRELLEDYASSSGIDTRSWVGAELSGFGVPHLNAFGSEAVLLDYDRPAGWGPADAVAEVQAAGGLVAYNHMFGVEMNSLSEELRAELVHEQIDYLRATDALGVDLLEVGYRHRGGLIDDFLEVWDALSMDGVYLTGIGTSDVHNDLSWERTSNNFVTWVSAVALEEQDMLWNLRRGAAWFGDPDKFPDGEVVVDVEVPAVGATQGQVVVGLQGPVEVTFAASELSNGWIVRAIADGGVVDQVPVSAGGRFATAVTVDPRGGRVVRFEVLDAAGGGVLYSNPIYFVDRADGVPGERLPRP